MECQKNLNMIFSTKGVYDMIHIREFKIQGLYSLSGEASHRKSREVSKPRYWIL